MFSIIDSSDGALKQADLCRMLEIKSSTMSTWKKTGKDPDAKYITRISEFLGCSVEFLLTGVESKKKEPVLKISENGREMLELYELLPEREQILLIGRLQEMTAPLLTNGKKPIKTAGPLSSEAKAV